MKKMSHAHDDLDGKIHSGVPWSVVAHAARKYWQGINNAISRPWWAYSVGPGPSCRHHEGLTDLVFRFDDPLWRSLYPPNDRNCTCGVRNLTAQQVEQNRLGTATYEGHEVPVVGKRHAENRGYRMHRLSAERRRVTPDARWLGRPVACQPEEVYQRGSYAGGGMIVPPTVSLPYADPEDRALPVATRRLAALRRHVTIELARIVLAESAGKAVSRSAAVLWAQAWDVDLDEGAALAAQSRHVAEVEAQGLNLESAAAQSACELAAAGQTLPGTAAQPPKKRWLSRPGGLLRRSRADS